MGKNRLLAGCGCGRETWVNCTVRVVYCVRSVEPLLDSKKRMYGLSDAPSDKHPGMSLWSRAKILIGYAVNAP